MKYEEITDSKLCNVTSAIALTEKAISHMRIHKGKHVTFSECMEEFKQIFKALFHGTTAPHFEVSSRVIDFDKQADRKNTYYVFESRNTRRIIDMAYTAWWQQIQMDNYDDLVTCYVDAFDAAASMCVALVIWEVDAEFLPARTPLFNAAILEKSMPLMSKYPKFDRDVRKLFDLINADNIIEAYTKYQQINNSLTNRFDKVAEFEFKRYLTALNMSIGGSKEAEMYISDLELWANKIKLNQKLNAKLKPSVKGSTVKI